MRGGDNRERMETKNKARVGPVMRMGVGSQRMLMSDSHDKDIVMKEDVCI